MTNFVADIRDARPGELSEVIDLNDAELPAVTPLPPDLAGRFVRQAAAFTVAEISGRLAGFLVALPLGLEYDSPNYRWFSDRFDELVYVDRIVVAPWARSRRVGAALYRDLRDRYPSGVIGCEVNVRPPNPRSLAFHERIGFVPAGEADTDNGKRVRYLVWRPSGGSP